ncbi:MAG: glycine zipper 2TM domain-containing protein [Rhodospirillales bacterium]|nr:glycine zipper 2TM domain-containing protein [Alphaproteobacteria bacterium]MCB1839163.1 glycine zipper 2TM domain-containing protein [Alphaproteobacteria bacterium]MCB9976482.1 glycine zipper 2TM domain-containing protein [Rhodospirillales bacterium]
MKKLALVSMLVGSLALMGCETIDGTHNKQLVGTGSGALIGGILGSKIGDGSGQLWATGAGALLGALIGSEIGQSLDKADQQYASQANYQATSAPIGEPVNWSNPESGNHGQVIPTREGTSASGRYCREFQQTIYVGGREESAYGVACQQPDGTWQIVNN